MNEPKPRWRKGGARWSAATGLKGQHCATAPPAPPPYRGAQVVVAHGPGFGPEVGHTGPFGMGRKTIISGHANDPLMVMGARREASMADMRASWRRSIAVSRASWRSWMDLTISPSGPSRSRTKRPAPRCSYINASATAPGGAGVRAQAPLACIRPVSNS